MPYRVAAHKAGAHFARARPFSADRTQMRPPSSRKACSDHLARQIRQRPCPQQRQPSSSGRRVPGGGRFLSLVQCDLQLLGEHTAAGSPRDFSSGGQLSAPQPVTTVLTSGISSQCLILGRLGFSNVRWPIRDPRSWLLSNRRLPLQLVSAALSCTRCKLPLSVLAICPATPQRCHLACWRPFHALHAAVSQLCKPARVRAPRGDW